MKQRIGFLQGLVITVLFFSCSPSYTKYISTYNFQDKVAVPDYSRLDYWCSNPYKYSLSDSVPQPLQGITIKDSTVDVFFLHPTTFSSLDESAWNADINDSVINAKTDYTTILYQASVFNECRIFAPRYRQANLRSYFTSDTANAARAFELAYQDLKTAFQYYLDHYNNGRPIIIASHSQGTTHAKRLLKEFFEDKPLKNKLVAAYILGIAIPKNYFSSLQPCKDSLQTGCFIGWRTFREGYEPEYVKKENGSSAIVNPLTWTNTEDYAPRALNQGAILTQFNTFTPEVADAQIHDGVLWIHKPHFKYSFLYRKKNYHIGDINLFYMNIRQNVRARIKAYWKQ